MKRYRSMIALVCFFLIILCNHGAAATYEAGYIPWSGYWWPFTEGGLVTGNDYRSHPAPLEKYDLAVSGQENGPATAYGLQYYYDRSAEHWEGMCFAWAAASILEAEPRHSGIYNGTYFRVGDKKAILTSAYNGTLYTRHNFNDPVDFHQVLDESIRIQGQPFIIDLGTDGEIWNYPVFKYTTSYITVGTRRHYTTTIYYASDAVHPDYLGSLVTDSTFYYFFELNSQNEIVDSGWEGSTTGEPPVKASEPYGTDPFNPGITHATAVEISSTDDDPFEANDVSLDAAAMESGHHALLGMDTDFFSVDLAAGDGLKIRMTVTGNQVVQWRVQSPQGDTLTEGDDSGELVLAASESGRYLIQVTPYIASDEPYYELDVEQRLSNRYFLPLDKKGNWYNGLALVADPDRQSAAVTDRLIFGQYDGDGWMQSAFTDTLDSGQKLSGNAKDDPLHLSRPNNGYLSISSDLPLAGMQAVSYGSNLLQGGNLIPGERMSAELFFPYFARTQGWKTYFGIINAGDAAEQVRLLSHGQYGELTGETTMELQAGEKIEYDTLTMSVLSASARSMRAQTTSGRSSLIGYILFWNPSFGAEGRGLIPLPLATASALEIPHVVQDGVWWTGLAAMNTTAQTINAEVEGYDSDGELLSTGLFTFRPYQQLALLPRELFDASDRDRIVRVRIKTPLGSDAALCGYMLYGTNNARMLAGLAIEPALDNTRLCVPHVISSASWWTGLALANTGESDDEVTFSLYDKAGALLGQVERQAAAGSRQIHLLGGLFETQTAVLGQYLVVESGGGQPLSGLYLLGSADGGQLTGDAMIPLR